jgi:hypothetical protein
MIRVAGVDQLDNLVAASAAFGGLLLTSTLVPYNHDGNLPAASFCCTTEPFLRAPTRLPPSPHCPRPGCQLHDAAASSPPTESPTRCPHSLGRRPSSTLGSRLRALEPRDNQDDDIRDWGFEEVPCRCWPCPRPYEQGPAQLIRWISQPDPGRMYRARSRAARQVCIPLPCVHPRGEHDTNTVVTEDRVRKFQRTSDNGSRLRKTSASNAMSATSRPPPAINNPALRGRVKHPLGPRERPQDFSKPRYVVVRVYSQTGKDEG